jgi:hypothetical protein
MIRLQMTALLSGFLVLSTGAGAQERESAAPDKVAITKISAPRLIRYSGAVSNAVANLPAGKIAMRFSLYSEQYGGNALWSETQEVQPGENGRYTVLLGATLEEGVPLDLFAPGKARWLEVGRADAGDVEQGRVLLADTPYALRAIDAETLGGIPAAAYARAVPEARVTRLETPAADVQNSATPQALLAAGTTSNAIPKFSSANVVTNSAIVDNEHSVGIAGSLSMNGDIAMVSAPRMGASAYLVGALVAPLWTATRIVPDQPITVTRITANLQTAGASCTAPPVIRVSGVSGGEDILFNNSQTAYDSGPQSLKFPAGVAVSVTLARGAVCGGTTPSNARVLLQYRMGLAADTLVCPSGSMICSGICEPVQVDPQNCGSCGHTCASGICTGGFCY